MVKITIKDQGDKMVAILDGYLDTPSSARAEEDMQPLFTCNDKDILFDCQYLDYIASSGLRLLLGILQNAKDHGHHVYIKDLNDTILDAFRVTGFINLFEYV